MSARSHTPIPAAGEAVKLSFHFGEHDRHEGRFLSAAILDLFERRRVETSILLRGAEGFGAGQRLRTDRLLSLSEDLPLVAIAVDSRSRIESLLPELTALSGDGLLTLERARLLADGHEPGREPHREVKLTVYPGRGRRAGGPPPHVGIVAALHRHGVAGATALLGVDGAARGERRRARILGDNRDVPSMVVAVGDRERIGAALEELGTPGQRPPATVEAVSVCRRDGRRLATPQPPPAPGPAGLDRWRLLTVYCSERSEHGGRSLYMELIRRLRAGGASGATALRGVWGYHGDHPPHGDRLLRLRRHVPVVLTAIDAPEPAERWLRLAEELTSEEGLLTVETVPALRISGPGGHVEGGLRLAGLGG